MTRLSGCCWFLLGVACASIAAGQTYTNPNPNSRYAPGPGASRDAGQAPVGAVQQPSRPSGPVAAAPRTQQPTGEAAPRVATGQQSVRQPLGAVPAPGVAAGAASGPPPVPQAAPQEPVWHVQMSKQDHQWVESVLRYWEQRSSAIKMFECKFNRFEYQPAAMPKGADPKHARSISQGVIKYAQPDKGLYRVEKLFTYAGPPKNPGEQAEYVEQDATFAEHWVCDGQQVFQFDARNKRMYVRPLPAEMRGKAIADGPLPFLFGARAETIQARYWVRGLPQSGNGEYWLEAVPKSRQDAQNFKMVHIILDEAEYLPKTIQVFEPNYDPLTSAARTTYIFNERQAKDEATLAEMFRKGLDPLGLFQREFYAPKLPPGWQRVVQND